MDKTEKGFYESLEPDEVGEEFDSMEFSEPKESIDDFDDDIVDEIDFSEITGGNFKSKLANFSKRYRLKKFNKKLRKSKRAKLPLDKRFTVENRATLVGGGRTKQKTIKRVIIPSDREVVVEGVDRLILGKGERCDSIRNIGYYKCRKLKEITLTMNNNSPLDFNMELFNPSQPLDYLFATSGNLNNKIQVAGGVVSYSDVLFNILANPTHIVNAKFAFAGVNIIAQLNQPLVFKQKNVVGEQVVHPLQMQLNKDIYQFQNDIVFFDFKDKLDRPYMPNGMDVIQYKVLPFNTVTMTFFYRQKDLRKFFFAEARKAKKLLS